MYETGWQKGLKSPDFRYRGDSLFSAKSWGKNFIHVTSGLAKDRLLSYAKLSVYRGFGLGHITVRRWVLG